MKNNDYMDKIHKDINEFQDRIQNYVEEGNKYKKENDNKNISTKKKEIEKVEKIKCPKCHFFSVKDKCDCGYDLKKYRDKLNKKKK